MVAPLLKSMAPMGAAQRQPYPVVGKRIIGPAAGQPPARQPAPVGMAAGGGGGGAVRNRAAPSVQPIQPATPSAPVPTFSTAATSKPAAASNFSGRSTPVLSRSPSGGFSGTSFSNTSDFLNQIGQQQDKMNSLNRGLMDSKRRYEDFISGFGADHPNAKLYYDQYQNAQRAMEDAQLNFQDSATSFRGGAAGGMGGGGGLGEIPPDSTQGLAHQLANLELDQRGRETDYWQQLQPQYDAANQRLTDFQSTLTDFVSPLAQGQPLGGMFDFLGQDLTPEEINAKFKADYAPIQENLVAQGLIGSGDESELQNQTMDRIAMFNRLNKASEAQNLMNYLAGIPQAAKLGQAPATMPFMGEPAQAIGLSQDISQDLFGRGLALDEQARKWAETMSSQFGGGVSVGAPTPSPYMYTGNEGSVTQGAQNVGDLANQYIQADRSLNDYFRTTQSPMLSDWDDYMSGPKLRAQSATDTVLANLFGFTQFPSNTEGLKSFPQTFDPNAVNQPSGDRGYSDYEETLRKQRTSPARKGGGAGAPATTKPEGTKVGGGAGLISNADLNRAFGPSANAAKPGTKIG